MTSDGERDILGLWIGAGGEGAKFWLQVLTEIKNRGVEDVCFVVCDGLKGLPQAIEQTWPLAITQTCVLHLIRNSFRLASRRYWDAISKDLRPVYTATTEQAAKERFGEFADKWGERYPAIIRLWENSWSEFVPFLDYSPEIRRVLYSTNAIESLNARLRRSVKARGHFSHGTGRVEVSVSGDPLAGPHRQRPSQVDGPLETRVERVRHRLRRPYHPHHRSVTTRTTVTPFS